MTSIRALIDGVWGEQVTDFPFFRENLVPSGNMQAIDANDISRISRVSRFGEQLLQNEEYEIVQSSIVCAGERARHEIICETTGNPGTPGNASDDRGLHFPLEDSKTGKTGKANLAGRPHSPDVPALALDEPEWVRDHAASLGIEPDGEAEPTTVATVTEAVTGLHARGEPARGRYITPTPRDDRDPAAQRLRAVTGLPVDWIDGALALSPYVEPCPGFRGDQWSRVYAHLIDFLTGPLARAAADAGWTTLDLFGVHPVVGIANVSAVGACLLVDHDRIRAVEPDAIRFDRSSFYRRPVQCLSTSVWSFGK